jgi:hypothetical protein
MLALPVDARARAACVCRSWRAFLADTSLWLHLDLTPAGGVVAERVTENLVRGAVARAGGQMRVLCLSRVPPRTLWVDVIVSHGAQLQQVNTDSWLEVADLGAVFAAAPRLKVFNAKVIGPCAALLPFLRNDPPYGPLRVSELSVSGNEGASDADVLAFAAAVAAHVSLTSLTFLVVAFARGLNALIDAAAERRVSSLSMLDCLTDADTVPALARLLQRSSLTKLEVCCLHFPACSGGEHVGSLRCTA